MKIMIFSLLFLFLLLAAGAAQTFQGDLLLSTQAQIDSFNYSAVKGNIYIKESEPGAITNLHGLRSLHKLIVTRVTGMGFIEGGDLYIDFKKCLTNKSRRIGRKIQFSA